MNRYDEVQVVEFSQTWFHGIRAIIIPMAQVSVIAGKGQPGTDKTGEANPIGMYKVAKDSADQDKHAGGDADLALLARLFSCRGPTGCPASSQASVPPFDIQDVLKASVDELLACLAGACAAAADYVERFVSIAIAAFHDGVGVERFERHIAGGRRVDFAELGRRADVDQLDVAVVVDETGKFFEH